METEMTVVYFDQIRVLHAPKSLSKYFFAIFILFCLFSTFFSDFTPEIKKKRLKMNKKMFKNEQKRLNMAEKVF